MDFTTWHTPPEFRKLVGGSEFNYDGKTRYAVYGVSAENEEFGASFTADTLMEALLDGRLIPGLPRNLAPTSEHPRELIPEL